MTGDSYLQLSYWQVALSAMLIVLVGGLSVLLQLGLVRSLLVATIRMTAQLLLVGIVLQWVFALGNVYVVLALASFMTLVAGFAAVDRIQLRISSVLLDSIISIWASSWIVTGLALWAIIPVKPWYDPQFALPLLGMVLGNTLSGISLGLDRFESDLNAKRDEIEGLLSLGATRWEASRATIRDAIRTGMIPTINAMMVTGLVSLPGMMTGQILSGVSPIEAVKYQLVIMFLIAAGTTLGTISIVFLSYRKRFTERHQLVMDAPVVNHAWSV